METEDMKNLITLFQRLPTPSRRDFLEKISSNNEEPINISSPDPQSLSSPSEANEKFKTQTRTDKSPYAKRYSLEEKKRAVILAIQLNNNRLAAIRLGQIPDFSTLHESTIRGWRRELENESDIRRERELRKNKKQVRELRGQFKDQESFILQDIIERRGKYIPVTGDHIKEIARQRIGVANPAFRASNGWLSRFVTRHNLSYRSSTHVVQKLLQDYPLLVSKFLESVRALRVKYEVFGENGKTAVLVGNMDETPVEFDMGRERTYHFNGAREVKILRTNGLKQRFTVAQTVCSDGTILPPLIIFKTKTNLPSHLYEKYKGRVILRSNSSGWMSSKLMNEWINKIWDNIQVSENIQKILILDQFSGHRSAEVLKLLGELSLDTLYIPPGCTSLVQPLDTDLNKPWKNRLREKFHEWLIDVGSKPTNMTKSGFVKAPDYETVIEWILQANQEIPTTFVRNAFASCGILAKYESITSLI
jgi:hypothetical protein